VSEPPDYVPRAWLRGPLNRWFWRSPRRTYYWLIITPIVALAFAVWAFSADLIPYGVILAVVAAFGLRQALVYGPRARRAIRQR
jgi:hypothetical protein